MSLDYPDFVQLEKRNRWLALLWFIGDIGYYLGLLGAVAGPLCVLGSFVLRWIRSGSVTGFGSDLVCALIIFAVFALILVSAGSLKAYARKRGGT